jgi:hypothetical protein
MTAAARLPRADQRHTRERANARTQRYRERLREDHGTSPGDERNGGMERQQHVGRGVAAVLYCS